jgi:Ca2+-transporting ATPase|tara:strand:- start:184 stop:543 length:360 start_codon:yes stop_codon:yes gene_type:complete
MSVGKTTDAVDDPDCELQSKLCVVFGGTAVTQGQLRAVVIGTGMSTEIGKIQQQIQQASEEMEDTPLKQKLDKFGDQLTLAIGGICLVRDGPFPNPSDCWPVLVPEGRSTSADCPPVIT